MPMIGGHMVGTGPIRPNTNPAYNAPPPNALLNAEANQNIANATTSSAADTARNIAGQDFTQKFGEFGQFMDKYGPTFGASSTTAGNAAAGVGTWTPMPMTSSVPSTISAPSSAALDSANFSRAKDTVGKTANAAIQGLQRAMESRGIAPGSSIEGSGLSSIYDAGLGQLSDVARQNAITDTNTATDLAKTNLGAAVTQRGQDIGANTAANQASLEARGQNISADEFAKTNQRESLAAILAAFKGLY